jgi:hypothetical protein
MPAGRVLMGGREIFWGGGLPGTKTRPEWRAVASEKKELAFGAFFSGRSGTAGLYSRFEFTGDGLLLRRGRPWSGLVFLLPAPEIQADG